ncbi:DNA-binding transcriptional regulator OxyR, partial [Mesorhizobium sp. M2D.F.Ca.ET.226.01.1.1]
RSSDLFKRLPQALFTLDALHATSDAAAPPGPALNG